MVKDCGWNKWNDIYDSIRNENFETDQKQSCNYRPNAQNVKKFGAWTAHSR